MTMEELFDIQTRSRPLTLCNCDCKLLTSAVYRGLHWYTMRCIHPSQRCISSRQMTDNIFEIETTALAHVACAPQDTQVSCLTDFAAVCPSVNHSWILSVIETELPDFSATSYEVFITTAPRTFRGSNSGTISYGQWCKTRLSCERLSFCNGIPPYLQMASRGSHPKEPWWPGFIAAWPISLR